jgi:hypothetical protein
LAFSASCPPDCKALRQRITLLAWQPMRRAISWRENLCFRNLTTLRLRSSNNFGDPWGRIETPPFEDVSIILHYLCGSQYCIMRWKPKRFSYIPYSQDYSNISRRVRNGKSIWEKHSILHR